MDPAPDTSVVAFEQHAAGSPAPSSATVGHPLFPSIRFLLCPYAHGRPRCVAYGSYRRIPRLGEHSRSGSRAQAAQALCVRPTRFFLFSSSTFPHLRPIFLVLIHLSSFFISIYPLSLCVFAPPLTFHLVLLSPLNPSTSLVLSPPFQSPRFFLFPFSSIRSRAIEAT